MEYTKIKNKEDNDNEVQFDKNTKLIDSTDDNFEIDNKNKKERRSYYTINNWFILIIIILIISLPLIYIYHIFTANIIKIDNNNTIIKEEEKNKTNKLIEEKTENITEYKIPYLQDVYKIESFSSLKKSFNKARKFLESNMNGTLLRKIPSEPIENPIVSVVIPVFNSKHIITKAIRSIQNQNINNTEIVLVNDNSTDDTLSFIKELQKEDQRIKIISNQKNMGILYTLCIGALSAKGTYIFHLDNDDMFLDEDVFQIITNIAEKGYFDIVEFKGIQ